MLPDAPNEQSTHDGNNDDLEQEVIQSLEPYVQPERIREAANVVHALMIQQSHSGPLPSSREFRGYEIVLPGSANRLLEMAEREQQHRHSLEAVVIHKEATMKGRGQWFALVALILMLSVVGMMAYWGHPVPAATLGTGVVIGVVALFLGQRRKVIIPPQGANPEK